MNTSGAALLALRALRSRSSTTPSGNTWTIRNYAATTKQKKVAAKPTSGTASGSGGSSSGGAGVNVAGKNLDPPGNVFKQVDKAALGPPGTSKDGHYKNPEYFSYHTMSYSDMEIVMEKFRVPQPSSSRK